MSLRPIDPTPFIAHAAGLSAKQVGARPVLKWLPISALVIDDRYQRGIGEAGKRNIAGIITAFDWAKFSPLIVAELDKGKFAIIDGQHRTTAAAARGLTEIPCQIVKVDLAKQAEAFTSINGRVTPVSSLQLHAARLAAGDAKASALAKACASAGVTICRYPIPANLMKAGETLAVGTLFKQLDKFGTDTFVLALKCITIRGAASTGFVRRDVVEAICAVLEAEPDWQDDDERLLACMKKFDLAKAYVAAVQARSTQHERISAALVDAIGSYLDEAMAREAA